MNIYFKGHPQAPTGLVAGLIMFLGILWGLLNPSVYAQNAAPAI